MMKKITISLTFLLCSLYVAVAQSDSTQIGSTTFAITSNNYGPFRTIQVAQVWSRYAYIYPAAVLNGVPPNAQLQSLSFYKDAYRNNPQTRLPGRARLGSMAKIWVGNTTLPDWINYNNFDTIIRNLQPTLVFEGDLGIMSDTTVGWRAFNFTSNVRYTGNNLIVLCEYRQDSSTANQVFWAYDDSTTIPSYSKYQMKYNNGINNTPFEPLIGTMNTQIQDNHPSMRLKYRRPNDIASLDAWESLVISPNPVEDIIRVEMFCNRDFTGNVAVIDVLGRVFQQKTVELLRGYNRLEFPIMGLAKGIYFLKTSDEKGQHIVKTFVIK